MTLLVRHVDSVPLAERTLAARAGLGFIGKNHMLINPTLGPQICLGEIITSLKLQTDEPIADSCRSCNKCIEACPTGALRTDGQFDANKCISYLTIEYKGQIPADLAERTGVRLFGCDECVLACPYQENAPICNNTHFKYYNDRARLDLGRILNLTEADFEAEFADSPIKRLGLERLKRNAQICLANIGC
ncbi:MAG: tRNA epoxyqueuosine(34) reductase QueG [Planctomycetota bacterium]